MGDITDAKRAQVEDIVKRKTNISAENIIITPIDASAQTQTQTETETQTESDTQTSLPESTETETAAGTE